MKRLLLLVALVLALPTAAAAHGDTGIIEVVSAEPAGATSVDYVVQLTYESDGDPVPDADVTVTVEGGEPLAMTPEGEGRYAATVTFPDDAGEHAVRFAAEEPAATLEHEQVVTTTTTDATASTTDAPNVAAEPLPDPDAAEGSSTWLLVLMAIIVVAMVVLAVAYVRGRRPPA